MIALRIPNGAGSFVFADPQGNADRPITVYTYRPRRYRVNDPILFVMHGVLRNGREYRDQWIVEAERFGVLLIAPEFPANALPGDVQPRKHVRRSRKTRRSIQMDVLGHRTSLRSRQGDDWRHESDLSTSMAIPRGLNSFIDWSSSGRTHGSKRRSRPMPVGMSCRTTWSFPMD